MMQSSPLNFRRAVIWLGRIVLAGFFIYAGYSKLTMGMHPRPPLGVALSFFAMQVDSYRILPTWGVKVVANTLPFAEIGLGLLLLTGWSHQMHRRQHSLRAGSVSLLTPHVRLDWEER